VGSLAQFCGRVAKWSKSTSVQKETADGRTVAERYEQEKRLFSSLPARAFRAERAVPVIATRQSLVSVEGATYSVPESWARTTVMAYVGVATVRFECRGETVSARKVAKGARVVKYLHYQKELARNPQAVRQVAPELLAELGEPYGSLWTELCDRYSESTAARVLAALIGLRSGHDADHIRGQIEKLLSSAQPTPKPSPQSSKMSLPDRLSALQIESGVAADYDRLLVGGGAR